MFDGNRTLPESMTIKWEHGVTSFFALTHRSGDRDRVPIMCLGPAFEGSKTFRA